MLKRIRDRAIEREDHEATAVLKQHTILHVLWLEKGRIVSWDNMGVSGVVYKTNVQPILVRVPLYSLLRYYR